MKCSVKKAREITDAKITFVSLVDKAANERQFLITKAENGQANFTAYGRIIKTDSDNHYVTGVVYEPLVEDAHGDFMSEEEITKAAHWFAKNGNNVDVQHSFQPLEGAAVVENWIAKSDFKIDSETIKKGTWLITAEITDNDIWDKIEKGEITGFSMGGQGKYSEDDVDLDDLTKSEKTEDKKGLLSKLAKALGLKDVVKGEMAEIYEEKSKSTLFWDAFQALQECLYSYNWNTNKPVFESDENKIRECLSDFAAIITDLLSNEKEVVKTLAAEGTPIEKAGKKMSCKNKETLSGIYESLGAFLKEFDEPENQYENSDSKPKDTKEDNSEEETELTKQEAEKLIQESVAKAFEAVIGKSPEQSETVEKSAEVTPEFIAETVQAAVSKALEPQQENVSADQIQEMITSAVEKAVEPIRKHTGVPSNLNDEHIEKQEEQHYLHGIL